MGTHKTNTVCVFQFSVIEICLNLYYLLLYKPNQEQTLHLNSWDKTHNSMQAEMPSLAKGKFSNISRGGMSRV
jgi:hypothetical protein